MVRLRENSGLAVERLVGQASNQDDPGLRPASWDPEKLP
jgi:hypothetical protein